MLIKCGKIGKGLVKLKVSLPQLAERQKLIAMQIMRIFYLWQNVQMSFSELPKIYQKQSLTKKSAIGGSLRKSTLTRSIRSYSSSLARCPACIAVSSFQEKCSLSIWRLALRIILLDEALCLRHNCRYRLLEVYMTSKLKVIKQQSIR